MPTIAGLVFGAGVFAFILFSISIPIVISYFMDRRAHEGVDWFKRRRVLANGQSAEATVLSSTILVEVTTGSKYSAAYSNVYDVRPPGGHPFRARGIEVMNFSEARHNNLDNGGRVNVRFDPNDKTVVLVRRDEKRVAEDAEAKRRAKEAALLRG